METLEADAAHRAKSTPPCASSWQDSKNATAPSAPPWLAWKRSWPKSPGAATELAREIERLGIERARLLADNIELDRKSAELADQIWPPKPRSTDWRSKKRSLREILAEAEEKLKALRAEVEIAHQKRSEIEVDLVKKQAELKYLDETSRKELNCARRGADARRRSAARWRGAGRSRAPI